MRQTRRASLLPKHRAVQFGFWVAAGGLFSSCHGVFIEIHEACPHTLVCTRCIIAETGRRGRGRHLR
jgi:hypothetical protein